MTGILASALGILLGWRVIMWFARNPDPGAGRDRTGYGWLWLAVAGILIVLVIYFATGH